MPESELSSIRKLKLSKSIKLFCLSIFFAYAFATFMGVPYIVSIIGLTVVAGLGLIIHLLTDRRFIVDRFTVEVYTILILWFIYCSLSVLWALDVNLVYEYMSLIVRYLVLFVLYSQLFINKTYRKSQLTLMQLCVIVYLGISVWELITFQHLPYSKHYNKLTPIPSGPFYGENLLAAFWLLLFPFVLVPGWLNNCIWKKILLFIVLLAMFTITVIVGARIAIIAMIPFIVYQWLFKTKAVMRLLSITLTIAIFFYVISSYPLQWKLAKTYAVMQVESFAQESRAIHSSSIQIRKNLLVEGLSLLGESSFVGVGGGNFEAEMATGRKHRTGGMVNPHNWWLEILTNFGLVFFFLFVYIYSRWIINLVKLYKHSSGAKKAYYLYHLISLLMFVPASILPSSIRLETLLWIYFAYIHSVSLDILPAPSTGPKPHNELEQQEAEIGSMSGFSQILFKTYDGYDDNRVQSD